MVEIFLCFSFLFEVKINVLTGYDHPLFSQIPELTPKMKFSNSASPAFITTSFAYWARGILVKCFLPCLHYIVRLQVQRVALQM